MTGTEHYAECRELLRQFPRRHIRRLIVTAIMLLVNVYFYVLTFVVKHPGYALEVIKQGWAPMDFTAFGKGSVALFVEIAFLAVAWFAEPQRPKLILSLFAISVLAWLFELFHGITSAVLILTWLTALPDVRKYNWVASQPGFPHFSERFDEQCRNRDYKATYSIKDKGTVQYSNTPQHTPLPELDAQALTSTWTAPEPQKPVSPEITAIPEERVTVAELSAPAVSRTAAPVEAPVDIAALLSEAAPELPPKPFYTPVPEEAQAPAPEREKPKDISHYPKCLKRMKFHKRTASARFILTALFLVINTIMFPAAAFFRSTLMYSGDAPRDVVLSFLFMIASIVVSVFILPLAASIAAEPTNVRKICLLLGILIVCLLLNILLFPCWWLVEVWATQLLEVKSNRWLREQEGYPYFNERMHEMEKRGTQYHADHTFSNTPVDETAPKPEFDADTAIANMRERQRRRRERETAETAQAETEKQHRILQEGETADSMPGVAYIDPALSAAPEAQLSEPEQKLPPLPDPTPEQPLPGWDDFVLDHGVPDIADDIPDLPEIPDIPKL